MDGVAIVVSTHDPFSLNVPMWVYKYLLVSVPLLSFPCVYVHVLGVERTEDILIHRVKYVPTLQWVYGDWQATYPAILMAGGKLTYFSSNQA